MLHSQWNQNLWGFVGEGNLPVLVIDETRTFNRILGECKNAVHAYDRTATVFVARMNWMFGEPRRTISDFDHPNLRVQMTYVNLKDFAKTHNVGLYRKDWQIWAGGLDAMTRFEKQMG